MIKSFSEIPEKIAKNQFLYLASLIIILTVFCLTQNVDAKYINLGILAFLYFYLAFFLNIFFVKVIYKGTTKNVGRWVEFFIFFVLTVFWLVISFITFFNTGGLKIEEINVILFTLIVNTLAVVIAVITYITGLIKERLFNNNLKRLLLKELFSNLLTINDNLRLIEQFEKDGKSVSTFAYITNNIFHSLVNTNKITTLGINIIPNLMSFYNNDQTIRKIMAESAHFEEIVARKDQDGSCLVKNKFIEMKKLLEQLFKDFKREEDYKKWQAKGMKDWQEYQKTIKDSSKISKPQIY
ncbi:hypothetical protein KAU51_02490 [Candidatus Parcubacteria bacterium]|nr:hypothetical protein [Candidatus Parcubacteria bacterium]